MTNPRSRKRLRMRLEGRERLRYFAPTAVCAYLSLLCLALLVTAAFLPRRQDGAAVAASAVFGLLLAGGLGLIFWRAQRNDLCYESVPTLADPRENFEAVRAAAAGVGWRITEQEPGRRIEAQAPGRYLSVGERVSIRFQGGQVLIASICDPAEGFSLVGRRRCEAHRELVRRAVLPPHS